MSTVRIELKHVKKPWGSFDQYTLNQRSTVKILTLKPGAVTSLQSHKKRREFWVALDKGICVEVGSKKVQLRKGSSIVVRKAQKHRLSCKGRSDARILEISSGHFSESDIVRYEDKYGRVSKEIA
jgi:mannose-6-phosphate isomerase-like protein (cupin superfamily)